MLRLLNVVEGKGWGVTEQGKRGGGCLEAYDIDESCLSGAGAQN